MLLIRRRYMKKIYPLSASIILVALAVWAAITPNHHVREFFERLDYLVYDTRVKASLNKVDIYDTPIVIVDIDEKSLGQEGRWPWPRHKVAKLIEKLREYGALVIAFDIIFAESERNAANTIQERIKQKNISDPSLNQSLSKITQLLDNDQYLADVIVQNEDVVLGYLFHSETEYSRGNLPKPFFEISGFDPKLLTVIALPGYTTNIDKIQNSTPFAGFLTTLRDEDGVVRRSPIVIRHKNKLYPSLALEAAKTYLLIDKIKPNFVKIGDYFALESVSLDNQIIPTDAFGQVIVPFRGKHGSFRYFSATDVINGNIKPDALKDTLVFVGTTALGLSDLQTTPVENIFPGVEVHANIAHGILSKFFPVEPDWSRGAEILTIVAVGLLLTLLLPFLGPLSLTLFSLTMVSLIFAFDTWLWSQYGLILSFSIPIIMVVLLVITNMSYGFLFENRKSRSLRRAFSQYVPPDHVKRISDNPGAYGFEGESRELTVLFADIRNFTGISEQLDAAKLKQLLNRYFTPMTEIIFNCGGTIDKYVGDMIMAFWGAPVEDANHRAHALEAAIQMIEKSEELKPVFQELELPEVNIGIGLNTGIMNVGDMGSEFRRSYTVLGDAVNLGSRIEGTTKFYGVNIAIGEETRKDQNGFIFRKLDRVKVKGKDKAVEVYQLCGRAESLGLQLKDELKQHERALALYFSQQWHSAKEIFEKLNQQYPNVKIYEILLERINYYLENPPPDDWDGSYVRTEK